MRALDSHAKHRRDDIERLCREPHAEGVALEQETLPELEEVVGTKGSLVQQVEKRLCGRMAFTFCDTRRMKL